MKFFLKKKTRGKQTLYVQNAVLVDGTALKSAVMQRDNYGYPVIVVTFTEEASKRLAELTAQNIGRRLAIVIEGKLYSAPEIRSQLVTGTAVISDNFTNQEAEALLAKINAALKR